MRRRHHPGKKQEVAHRASGGGVHHHPHNAMKVSAGEGHTGKLHGAKRARGGSCWYCGGRVQHHKRGGAVKKREDGGGVGSAQQTNQTQTPKPEEMSKPADGDDRKSGGGIHIKKSHEGLLTAKAERAGESLSEFEHSHKNTANKATKKQIVFAENAKKWHHH